MPQHNFEGASTSDVADRLRITREALGLTQAAIGNLAGISAQAWNNNERGRDRISLDQAIKLCIATGISLDWIFRGDMSGLRHDLAAKIMKKTAEKQERRRRA